jgi:hypothetical protein
MRHHYLPHPFLYRRPSPERAKATGANFQTLALFAKPPSLSGDDELLAAVVLCTSQNIEFLEVPLLAVASAQHNRGYDKLAICLAMDVSRKMGLLRCIIGATAASPNFLSDANLVSSHFFLTNGKAHMHRSLA